MSVQLPPRPILRNAQTMLRFGGCARSRLGASGGEAPGGGAACNGSQPVSLGNSALPLPSPGSCAWIPLKPERARLVPADRGFERNGVQSKRISPLAIAGAIGYDCEGYSGLAPRRYCKGTLLRFQRLIESMGLWHGCFINNGSPSSSFRLI
jgi:hypothetical protein